MKKAIISTILIIFLIGFASAGNGNSENNGNHYGQYKNGIRFTDEVNINDFTVIKNQNHININSNKHYETSLKIPYSDLQNLEGFNGIIKIKHYTNEGLNDWNKLVKINDKNGYIELNLEFSTVDIEAYLGIFSWGPSSKAVSGLSDVGLYSTPEIFEYQGSTYLIAGGSNAGEHGYIWSGSAWSSDSSISSGLNLGLQGNLGVFEIGGTLYAIEGDISGVPQGYVRGASTWYSNTSIISGLSADYGDDTSFTPFWMDGSLYLLVNEDENVLHSYKWGGSSWASYPAIKVGLPATSRDRMEVQEIDGIFYAFVGHSSGTTTAYYWNSAGSTWESISISGIPDVGTRAYPAIFQSGGETYLVIGEYDGIFNGYISDHILFYPNDGETITVYPPPLKHTVNFNIYNLSDYYNASWELYVYSDNGESNLVYSETGNGTISTDLIDDTYYWKAIHDNGSLESDLFNFTLNASTNISGTGIQGIVYDIETETSLDGAIVQCYNNTWSSDPYTTSSDGYFYFSDLTGGETYAIYATKSGYVNSDVYYATPETDSFATKHVPMQENSGEGVYYSPYYVRFVVTDSWYWERYVGATVTVYENDDTTALYTSTTGSDGAVGFKLSENVEYRIVTTYGDITQTDYIYPTESTYYIVLEDIETSLLPDNQFYDVVSINITKTEINSTNAEINIVYNDSAFNTNSVYFVLGQTYNNGTLNILDTSPTYTEDCQVTFNITGYFGQSYIIKAVIDHGDFGEVTKYFSVDFPSNNLPFTGKGVVYLCILVLFVVAAQFGKADNTSGAILLCGLTWFMYGMDIFLIFGESVNTLIEVGLGIATAYALLAYINKKRTEEGI